MSSRSGHPHLGSNGRQVSTTYTGRKRARVQIPSHGRSINKQNTFRARSRALSEITTSSAGQFNHNTSEVSEDKDVDDGAINEVIMAVDMRNRDTIGSAYFVSAEETLYVLTDIKYGGIDIINKLKQYAEPSVILISSRVDETVEDHLRTQGTLDSNISTNVQSHYVLDIRPTHEFNYDSALRKLVDLDLEIFREAQTMFIVPGDDEDPAINYERGLDPGLSHIQGHILRLSSAIDVESHHSISCIGAILSYIQRRRAIVYLPGDPSAVEMFKVTYLETFGLTDTMSLSSNALMSLQILHGESHPHAHNQGPSGTASGSKEGLSVFGLFQNLASTPQGGALLRQYFLRPSLDIRILAQRHECIRVFLLSDNEILLQSMVKSLKHIKDMKATIQYLRKGISNSASKGGGMKSSVWFRLRSFAYYALMIEQDIRGLSQAEKLYIRRKIMEGFDRRALAAVGKAIIDIIDFGESQNTHRTVVLRGVDATLDNMKRQYDGLEDMLNQVSEEISQTIPQEFADSLSVVFFPQIGFLIAMPVDPATEDVRYRDSGWKQSFYTIDRIYFKDYRMVELDNTIGDIYADICDREIEIVYDLAQRVLEHANPVTKASDICGELDCLLALTQGAKTYNLVQPTMTHENLIRIRRGWHILQALVAPVCIPNDIEISGGSGDAADTSIGDQSADDNPSILFLTGPNYSGKSVYLKQNAIIVYLAHVGCFVPAAEATIGITDQILTRITTTETVSRMQSAFFIDLQQVSSALYSMTRQSLLVIDEFGKGTNNSDGIGLMSGLLQYLLGLGNSRPKVVGATHFHEVFEARYIEAQRHIGFAHMEVRVDENATGLEDRIAYLYNLVPGRSTSSFGLVCAGINGIESSVITRAEYLLKQQARGVDLADLCAGSDEQDYTELEQAEDTARVLLALEFGEDPTEGVVNADRWLSVLLAQDERDNDIEMKVEMLSSATSASEGLLTER